MRVIIEAFMMSLPFKTNKNKFITSYGFNQSKKIDAHQLGVNMVIDVIRKVFSFFLNMSEMVRNF